ncbi:hypothetical protein KR084_004438 [Drosophila pseudotakahashii]|nr:hypothetical protein KR084_004438 [Drosophila pseudotakahashii]
MRLIVGTVATIILLFMQVTKAEIVNCDFYDTVNISTVKPFMNGSYEYDGLLIPAELTGVYNTTLLPDGSKKDVPSHIRGCVCKLKPCIRFCCPHNHKANKGLCIGEMSKEELESHNRYVNVTLSNGTVAKRHFKEDLVVQSDLPMPCGKEIMHWLDHTLPGNGFTLFESGTSLRHWDSKTMDKREYCVQHVDFKGDGIRIAPHFCETKNEVSKTRQTIVISISLICMVLTIGVYLYVKKLHNMHGKCFICYMVALFLGYLILLLSSWEVWDRGSIACITSGTLGYYFVMAAFFWLSVIGVHLWITIALPPNSVSRFLPGFLAFNSYSWGLALVLTGVIVLADNVIQDKDWAPRMGTAQCWIYTGDNISILYFFGPMLLLIIFNITMFILTAIRIINVKKEVKNCAQHQQQNNRLSSDKQKFAFFLRLFIIMGLTWSLEIISFLVRKNELWSRILRVADYLNWSQGTIIFVLFILKPSTLKRIKQQ